MIFCSSLVLYINRTHHRLSVCSLNLKASAQTIKVKMLSTIEGWPSVLRT